MKKITFLLFLFFISFYSFAQVSVVEDFDAGTALPTGWTQSGFNSASATQACAGNSYRDNLYSGSATGTITTPNQVGLSNATDLTVSFDYKVVDWSAATAATPAGWGSADLQYSTDDGATWVTALTINDDNHVVANTCATMMTVIPAASLPMASDVKIQIANTWTAGDYYFYIDNFSANQVSLTPPNCDSVLSDISAAGDVSWSAATGIPSGYRLTVGTTTGGNDVLDNFDVMNVLTYNIGATTVGTTYYITIVSYNANGDATGCTEQTFTVPCLDPTAATTTNITLTSADLGWTENNGAMSWNVEWGADGFVQGTGTTIAVTTNPYTLMNLESATAYDYYVQTDCGVSTSAWVGPISFTTLTPPPANDDFANATPVVCGGNYTGTTAFATLDEDNAPDGFGADMDAPNVWFSYTGTGAAEDVTVDLCPSAYDSSVLIYTGTSGALTLVAGNDDNGTQCGASGGTTRSYVTFASDGTSTYFIAVEGFNATSTGAYDLTITCAPACSPAQMNQDCASATAITVGAPAFTVDNTCASINPVQTSCDSFNSIADVWYSFVMPASGNVSISSVLGTATAVHMAVYSGACGTLTSLDCSAAVTSSLSVAGGVAGDTYYLQLWNNGSEEGTFDVTVVETPPTNDECADATLLVLGTLASADTSTATMGTATSACDTASMNDVWFSFTATATGAVMITTTADQFAVHADCATPAAIACTADGVEVGGLTAGTTYYLRVWNDGQAFAPDGAVDVTVAETTLSTTSFDNKSLFTYYPNPVNDVLTLQAQKEISNVAVYNMVGQEVYRNAPNAISNEVNMSNLQAGAYFVEVSVGDATETIKVIKK